MPSDISLDVFYLNGALICFCFYNTVPEVKKGFTDKDTN